MNELESGTAGPFGDPSFLLVLGLVLLLMIGGTTVLRWIRAPMSPTSRLSRALGLLDIAFQVFMVGIAISMVAIVVPRPNTAIGLMVIVAIGVGLGWSTRDVLPDAIAGLVLMFERRIRKGMWVSGEGFEGTVERRTLRATWLRDTQGHRLAVPNRAMVRAPIVYDAGADTEYEVVVRLEGYDDASVVRQSLHDSVLSSPWVLAGAVPVVLRDPQDPVVWRVRTKLLEPRFAVQFEGEVLERTEDLLRYEPPSPDDHEPDPG